MQSTNFRSPFEEAKTQARLLRIELANKGISISHSQSLERIAQQLGFRDWNTAAARLSNHPDIGKHDQRRPSDRPPVSRLHHGHAATSWS